MTLQLPNILVSVDWLQENIQNPQLIVLDASSHMPAAQRDGHSEWLAERIPGSKFFDFDHKICDPESSLPHMLPDADIFTQEAQQLGINQDSVVVVYDSLGIFSAPRAWWMLTTMGHKQCAVLDGGLPAWKTAGGPVESGEISPITSGNFIATLDSERVKASADMLAAINDPTITILDARSAERFYGEVDEPRPGLRRGHIPSSGNLPFTSLLENGKFKDRDTLSTLIAEKLAADQQLYASCGTGITACVVAFAAALTGVEHFAVYDGSWTEWGQPDNGLPVTTGHDQ